MKGIFVRPQTFATHAVLPHAPPQRVLEPGPAPGWGRALLSHVLKQLGLTVPQFPHITTLSTLEKHFEGCLALRGHLAAMGEGKKWVLGAHRWREGRISLKNQCS